VPKLNVAEVVRRHQLYRRAAQQPLPVELAAVQQRLQKARVVGRSRREARAAGEAFTRTLDIRALPGREAWKELTAAAQAYRAADAARLAYGCTALLAAHRT
jgi:hypothetical protein